MQPFTHPFVHPSVRLSAFLRICLLLCPSVNSPIRPSLFLSVHTSVSVSVCAYVRVSVRVLTPPSMHSNHSSRRHICPSVCPPSCLLLRVYLPVLPSLFLCFVRPFTIVSDCATTRAYVHASIRSFLHPFVCRSAHPRTHQWHPFVRPFMRFSVRLSFLVFSEHFFLCVNISSTTLRIQAFQFIITPPICEIWKNSSPPLFLCTPPIYEKYLVVHGIFTSNHHFWAKVDQNNEHGLADVMERPPLSQYYWSGHFNITFAVKHPWNPIQNDFWIWKQGNTYCLMDILTKWQNQINPYSKYIERDLEIIESRGHTCVQYSKVR